MHLIRRWPRRHWKLLLSALSILIIAGGAGVTYLVTRPLIPASVANDATSQLYYPKSMPNGCSVDSQSFSSPKKGIVIFVVRCNGHALNISEQPRPQQNQLNVGDWIGRNVGGNTTTFSTTQGDAAQGQLHDNRQFGSLLTDETWVIVTASQDTPPHNVHDVIQALQPLA